MKKLWVLIPVIAVSIAGFAAAPSPKQKLDVAPQTLYNNANELYFFNRLPRDGRVVMIEADIATRTNKDEEVMALTYITQSSPRTYKTLISTKYNLALPTEELSVLHEACHIEVYEQGPADYDGQHGPEFQNCMLRLAKMGAFEHIW
jgi:hypothetical protein